MKNTIAERVIVGAAAGLAGTMVMYPIRLLSQSQLPGTVPPMQQEPGEYMVDKAEFLLPEGAQEKIPDIAETAAAQSLAMGYGAIFGVLYAALRPRGGDVLADGAALGVASWAAGYLGWLPALGLTPPVAEQEAGEVIGPIVRHVIYGVATVAAYNALQNRL